MNQQNKFTDMQGMTLRKFGGHTLVISSKILAAKIKKVTSKFYLTCQEIVVYSVTVWI